MPLTDLILLRVPNNYSPAGLPFLLAPKSESLFISAEETASFDMLNAATELEKAGFKARAIDLAQRGEKSRFDPDFFIGKLDAPFFAVELSKVSQCRSALLIAGAIKKHHPKSRTIFFGCAAALFHEELISRSEVDFVVRGQFNGAIAIQILQTAGGKFGKISNLVWKEARGKVRENDLSAEQVSFMPRIADCCASAVSQVLRYHDFDSGSMMMRWLHRPVVMATGKPCGNRSIEGNDETASSPAVRAPEDIYRDILEICRFTPEPIYIKGDIRELGSQVGERLLSLIQHDPVANALVFEFNDAPVSFFIQEIARAAPGFRMVLNPGSHDESIRKQLGYSYSNQQLEASIAAALKARAQCVSLGFFAGLPGQNAGSVMDTVNYCEYLLRKFDGDRRLLLSAAPCLEPLDCVIKGKSESYGFKRHFRAFDKRLEALALPYWKDRLEYRTSDTSAEEIATETYDFLARLARLRGKYGQVPYKESEYMAANYELGKSMTVRLGKTAKIDTDEIAALEHEIATINKNEEAVRERSGLSLMFSRPLSATAIWKALLDLKKTNREPAS